MAGFGARAPALIGESLKRCFRAQWRCYPIVSGLNGLLTVCLKDSNNEWDQLISGSLHTAESRQTQYWMNTHHYKRMISQGEVFCVPSCLLRCNYLYVSLVCLQQLFCTDSSHLRAKQVFPKTLRCQKRVPSREVLQPVSTAHTPNKGRYHTHTHSHTHRKINAAPFMWKVFSQHRQH